MLGVLLGPLLEELLPGLEGPLRGPLGLLFPGVVLPELGPLEGPLDAPLFGPLEGLLGPLEGPLFGPLFTGTEGLDGVFPLVFPGLFGVGGVVVVGGGSPGTPRPLREESNIGVCSRERLPITRGQKRGRMVTRPFLVYKQTTEG